MIGLIQPLTGADWFGVAPMLCVAAGITLALLADIIPPLKPARGLAYLGCLVAAFLFEMKILAEPEALAATMYHQMGIISDKEIMAPGDRPIEIVNGGTVLKGLIS